MGVEGDMALAGGGPMRSFNVTAGLLSNRIGVADPEAFTLAAADA